MKKHIGTFLILLGVVVIAVPLIGRYIATKRQEEMVAAFLEQNATISAGEEFTGLNDSLAWGAESGNQEVLTNSADSLASEPFTLESFERNDEEASDNTFDVGGIKAKPDAIGLMEIDKIDVYLPVAEGVDLDTLKFALGHMPETAPLGSVGNAVVAGHRSHSFGTFFNRLDEVEVGDEIKVTAGGNTYTYEVYEILIVDPNDTSVLRQSSKYQVLTLITCHPLYTSTHRLIVHAVIKEES